MDFQPIYQTKLVGQILSFVYFFFLFHLLCLKTEVKNFGPTQKYSVTHSILLKWLAGAISFNFIVKSSI